MKLQRRFPAYRHYVTGPIPAVRSIVTVPSDCISVTDSFAAQREVRELQPEWAIDPAAAAALAINTTVHDHSARGWCSLRLAADPLHLPLLQAVMPARPPQLAFRSADAWAERLLRRELDAVLLPHAGAAADPATSQPPRLARALRSHVELIALGQRPLLLFHHPGASGPAGGRCANWPPRGYLLPPADHSPLLTKTLSESNRLPLSHCAAPDPQIWLQQLAHQSLLLPAHLTLLTASPWRGAGLVPLVPLNPLHESLWLLLRRGESSRPEIKALLQWWGGSRLASPPPVNGTAASGETGLWWRWLRRAGLRR